MGAAGRGGRSARALTIAAVAATAAVLIARRALATLVQSRARHGVAVQLLPNARRDALVLRVIQVTGNDALELARAAPGDLEVDATGIVLGVALLTAEERDELGAQDVHAGRAVVGDLDLPFAIIATNQIRRRVRQHALLLGGAEQQVGGPDAEWARLGRRDLVGLDQARLSDLGPLELHWIGVTAIAVAGG